MEAAVEDTPKARLHDEPEIEAGRAAKGGQARRNAPNRLRKNLCDDCVADCEDSGGGGFGGHASSDA